MQGFMNPLQKNNVPNKTFVKVTNPVTKYTFTKRFCHIAVYAVI